MSDTILEDDQDHDDDASPKGLRNALKSAQAEAATAKAAAAEAQAELNRTRREAAFATAGIDVNSPQGKFFAENYQGPVEEIAAKAAELGIVGQQQTQTISPEVRDAWQQTAAAPNGGVSAMSSPDETLKRGMTPQQIAEDLRRRGELVGNAITAGPDGSSWVGR